MLRSTALAITTLITTGCSLDKIADPDQPSDFQRHTERLALLTTPTPATPALKAIETAAPVTAPQHEVIPGSTDVWVVAVETGPECVPVFRLVYCSEETP